MPESCSVWKWCGALVAAVFLSPLCYTQLLVDTIALGQGPKDVDNKTCVVAVSTRPNDYTSVKKLEVRIWICRCHGHHQ